MVNENTQSFVQTPADGAGKKLDTHFFTTTAGTVIHREIMAIGGTTLGQVAGVFSVAPPAGSPGVAVRSVDNISLYSQLPRVLGQATAASSLSVVVAPRPIVVVSPTSASFLANVTVLGKKQVGSDTAASFLVTVPGAKNVLSVTAASFNVTVAGAKNVLSATAASFNVTAILPGLSRVQSATAASFNVTAILPGLSRVQSATAASFNVTVAGAKNVLSVTAASFNVTVAGAKNVLSATAASFNMTAVNVATARSTWPTAEANNALGATFITDLTRRLEVIPYSHPEDTVGTTVSVSLTAPISLFGATASRRAYITSIMGSNSSATNTTVDVFDRVTTGRRFVSAFIAASGGGFAQSFIVPIRGNTNSTVVVRVTPTVSAVLVSAQGYSAP